MYNIIILIRGLAMNCSGCKMLVVEYEDDPNPFRYCNKYMCRTSEVEKCDH